MDITTVFETVISGSNPDGSTETVNVISMTFPAKVLTEAMFRQQVKPQGGVAEISSDDEKLL